MKTVIYLDTVRNGYSPEQCGKTMTAGELIAILEEYDEDTEIFFKNDNGYTYGNLTEHGIEEDYIEDDE